MQSQKVKVGQKQRGYYSYSGKIKPILFSMKLLQKPDQKRRHNRNIFLPIYKKGIENIRNFGEIKY